MKKQVLYRSLGQLIYLIFLGWVTWYFYNLIVGNWTLIIKSLEDINYPLLILSFLLFILYVLATGILWGGLVRKIQNKYSFWQSCIINNIAQIGKYFPGKVWSYIGRWYIGRDYGLNKKAVVVSIINEFVLFVTSGFIVSMPALLPYFHNIYIKYTYGALCILILLFYQTIFDALLRLYKKLKKVDIKIPKLTQGTVVYYLILYMLLWSLGGFSFYLLAISFHFSSWSFSTFVDYNALFAASYLISYIALFAPGGIGVREFIQNAYLPVIGISGYQSAVLALFARMISTTGDIVLYLASIVMLKKYRKKKI